MAKPDQDQVNWPYPPHFYPQPHSYNIPYSPQGRVCQESCCRRPQAPISYPHHMEQLQHSLPYRSSQDNANASYARARFASQGRSFVPINPYVQHVQQHEEPLQHLQPGVHRPIPQTNYDYSDFYRYGSGSTSDNSQQQGFHPTAYKTNANVYSAGNSSSVVDQYPACSQYTPTEPESSLPSLDVRQFLATWQDKDEDVLEDDKAKGPSTPNADGFKPLDYTKRNERPTSSLGYKQNPMASSSAYYSKPVQSVPDLQPMMGSSFKPSPYVAESPYLSASDNSCNQFNSPQANLQRHEPGSSQRQHGNYERRIDKIFNPHAYKTTNSSSLSEQTLCAADKGSLVDMKTAALPEKTQYHLSASLESEDLFDDINRKREERQRNIVHPLRYQDIYTQRENGNMRSQSDLPKVSVKPNTAAHAGYAIESFAPNNEIRAESDLKKFKTLPLKKWTHRQEKLNNDYFPNFNISDPILDFSTRDPPAPDRSQTASTCDSNMELIVDDNDSCIPENLTQAQAESFRPATASPDYGPENVTSPTNAYSTYPPLTSSIAAGERVISNSALTQQKPAVETALALTMCADDVNISIDSHVGLVTGGNEKMDSNPSAPDFLYEPELTNSQHCEILVNAFKKAVSDVNDNISSVLSVSDRLRKDAAHEELDKWNYSRNSNPNTPQSTTKANGPSPSELISFSKDQLPKRSRTFSLLMFWRYRNRLFPKTHASRKATVQKIKLKHKPLRKYRQLRDIANFRKLKKGAIRDLQKDQGPELEVNDLAYPMPAEPSSISNNTDDLLEIDSKATPEPTTTLSSEDLGSFPSDRSENSSSNDLHKPSFTSSDIPHSEAQRDDLNALAREDYLAAAGSSGDGVLQGILNWPHHQEEITSINEQESIKVSLPWGKIFKPHSESSNIEKSLDIGPARVELRYSPAPVEFIPGHYQTSRGSAAKKSSVFSVKNVVVKNNVNEKLPKMVIKKTGGEKYKSYLKDAKLRVVSIKNCKATRQAEIIIETDRPLEDPVEKLGNPEVGVSNNLPYPSELPNEHHESEPSSEFAKELHHCLLCFATFTSLDKLHIHEKSAIHRHVDILQRSWLHKLQSSFRGIDVPAFQPLSASEIEYLKWRPSFPGFNHFYHNIPL